MPKHGYLLIDNTASGGQKFETDTTHCRHCQAVIDKRAWARDGGTWKCSGCGPICKLCALKPCDPWQEKINRQLKFNEMIVRGDA